MRVLLLVMHVAMFVVLLHYLSGVATAATTCDKQIGSARECETSSEQCERKPTAI